MGGMPFRMSGEKVYAHMPARKAAGDCGCLSCRIDAERKTPAAPREESTAIRIEIVVRVLPKDV